MRKTCDLFLLFNEVFTGGLLQGISDPYYNG
jgi:hypothetical protein